ncbi:unnamed protein product [Phytophthora fragariaefolia]|uniref:Unnamed protein product n=1 Tax=Phytophthora fragariaefolia TaxID=1490495 RepID=A0A9W6Y9F3_9STRA|nr:unnamed protein product [Phytophthora fragariaefolia]
MRTEFEMLTSALPPKTDIYKERICQRVVGRISILMHASNWQISVAFCQYNNEQHTQAGPVVNKDAELNNGFSLKTTGFVQRRLAVIRFVQDAIAASVDRQKLNADNNGRGNSNEFKVGSLVLLATQNLAKHAVSDFGASKLAPRFIGPFTVLAKHGNAYTLDIPSSMRLHPTFYVGRLKPYAQHESPSLGDSAPTPARARRRAFARHSVSTQGRPARSKQSARPARAGPSTRPAPASTQ